MMAAEAEKLIGLPSILAARVKGQAGAVEAVAEAIMRSRAGLADPSRPLASFLFLGPTGVGKTELAKTLAAALFDDEEAMVRLDMSDRARARVGVRARAMARARVRVRARARVRARVVLP